MDWASAASQMALTYELIASLRSRDFRLESPDSLKHGFSEDTALEASVLEAERAEWIAIISLCIDNGVLASFPPPPILSKGVKVLFT